MICGLDFLIRAVLLSEWILVDGSGPKGPTGKRPDTYRRQRSSQNPDAVPRLDPGPARARRLRHERDDRVSYYGQESEFDAQGRIVIPQQLRDSGSIVGDVRVFGKIDHLEVWNEERFAQKLARDQWTDEDGVKLSEHGI